ncbi:MAG: D-aminoacyl-tRNA deacylase, partial [Candidatus Thermoplasmatota archaeon]|nr:D-aminoacyl-tRNA deacylase [Candidatus Thermoplasmatota archaeon]
VVIFLSRHKAASGNPSLTVHPIGNFTQAPYGGQPGRVVPTHPGWMLGMLEHLKEHGPDGYDVCYEATHHGPWLELPTCFLELGSTEEQWADEAAAGVLADAVLETEPAQAPTVLWVGGGHYCPQVTDLALAGELMPGHIIPNWAIEGSITDETLEEAVEATPGCQGYVLQRNATNGEQKVAERLEALGVPAFELDA